MLAPSIVVVVLWLVASGYLVFQGFYTRAVADSVRSVSIPAVSALTSIMQERRLSITHLAQRSGDLQPLVDQRKLTDDRLSELRAVATEALGNAPDSIVTRWRTLTEFLDQLPSVRSTVDSRSIDGPRAFGFYNNLLDAATTLFDTQARVVPDVTATQGGITATDSFRVSDLMSRAASRMDGAFGARAFGQQDYLEFVSLVGSYHAGLATVTPHLLPGPGERLKELTDGDAWRELVAAEQAIITGGAWQDGVPRNLSSIRSRWEALTGQVSERLIEMTVQQADEVSAEALRTGNNQLLMASLASLVAASIAGAAILWAWRKSSELPVRLSNLGEDAATMVDQRLPAMMERLRRHEKVDPEAELSFRDYGSDEIGQMAEVINRSLRAAAAAAIDEATTRAASTAMLMGVARRPQRPLQRGLKVIEGVQHRVGDEKLLSELFDINHQLTQARRFLENLLILAGGQIGRRFQSPVPVRRVLLAAFAEAQHYQRITLRGAPDVAIVGQAVAGTIHLLSELLDNALAFSPPGTTVWVTANEVANGVAVEVEDSGVGMRPDALERANELLRTAPTPDVTALKDGAQIGLHVVTELAKRHGIQVTLRPSAYGGLLAVVLLPKRVIAVGDAADRPEPTGQSPVPAGPAAPKPEKGARREPRPAASSAPAPVAASPNGTARSGSAAKPGAAPVPSGVGGGSPAPQASARPPLPQRDPQQHLAPGLRAEPTSATAPRPAGPARPAEQARDRLAGYQRGWAAGRAAGIQKPNDDQGRKA
ncbi:nitrate- and nitrite sensing domain-containing protein [Plantactinospora sp. BC1]|uniref:sensor histidine kinase n=1 Tax=Plantactinospora sp. BC1 TaxID=2108470 RepID=UPI001F3AF1E5|nr:nitrate- and nitrite sensing domain-containing protein [Plantactinospora sp. BC1]